MVAIVNGSGTTVVSYVYDVWGRLISTDDDTDIDLGEINPLRYRGYIYDQETGLYYLQSRYYNPTWGRFINADAIDLLGANGDFASYNLFAYCGNNPVACVDSSGYLGTNILIGAAVGAIAGLVGQIISDVVTSALTGETHISNWQTYAGAVIGGATGGVVLAATGSIDAANAATGFMTTGVAQSLEKLTHVRDDSWIDIGSSALRDGAVSYALGTFLSGVPKITSGRNSMMAVYQSGLTKIRNDAASRMATSVMAKGLTASIVGGLYLDVYYGIMACA